MQYVVLITHLLLALSLIGVVLMQRSEGGGLGMGGGGGAATGRSAGTALGKVTWLLATAFICTSITLTIIAAQNAGSRSVLDRIVDAPIRAEPDGETPSGGSLLPPAEGDDAPLLPTAE